MSAHIAGFICALILAAFVIIWIAYCMFFREKHKPEFHQFDISDLRRRNYQLAQELEAKEEKKHEKEISAGIFIIPSRHKQKDDYEKRPDYPESPVPNLQAGSDQLVDIFNEKAIDADVHYKDGIYEVDSSARYHSDV